MYTDKKKNITKSTVSTLVEFESWVQRRVADQVEQNIKQSLMIGPKQGNIFFFITVDTAATYKHYSRSMCSKRKENSRCYIYSGVLGLSSIWDLELDGPSKTSQRQVKACLM